MRCGINKIISGASENMLRLYAAKMGKGKKKKNRTKNKMLPLAALYSVTIHREGMQYGIYVYANTCSCVAT